MLTLHSLFSFFSSFSTSMISHLSPPLVDRDDGSNVHMLDSVRDEYRSASCPPSIQDLGEVCCLRGCRKNNKYRTPYLVGSTACVSSSNHGWLKTDHLRCHKGYKDKSQSPSRKKCALAGQEGSFFACSSPLLELHEMARVTNPCVDEEHRRGGLFTRAPNERNGRKGPEELQRVLPSSTATKERAQPPKEWHGGTKLRVIV